MSIIGVIIARLWLKMMNSTSCAFRKFKCKLSAYIGLVAVLPNTQQEDRFEAVCQILIEKYGLTKLNSPFSGHSIFLYDGNYIWEIDKTDTSVYEVIVKKPESAIYGQLLEFNELTPPKISIYKDLQKDRLVSMKV